MNGWGRLIQSRTSEDGDPIGDNAATFGWWQDSQMHGNSQTFNGKNFHLQIESGWYQAGRWLGQPHTDSAEFKYLDFNEPGGP